MAISIDKYVDINSASSGAGSGDSVPAGSSDIQLFRDPASGRYFTPSEYVGTVEKRADGKYYANGTEANVVTYQTSVTGRVEFSQQIPAIVSKTRVTVTSIGDSISRNNYTQADSGGQIGTQRTWTLFGAWVAMAAWKTGGYCVPDVYACEGYSGQRTDQILASMQTSTATETWGVNQTISIGIAARPQQIVVVMAGTNDLTYYETAADADGIAKTVAGIRALWAYVRETGAIPVALSLLPRNSPALFADRVPAYNEAIKSAAKADGVCFVDAYSVCVGTNGAWKDGFIFHQGVNDATGLHPSFLATQAISDALALALINLIDHAPKIPRIAKGSPAIYSVPYRAGAGDYYAQFADGAFPTAIFSARYNPTGAGSVALAATSIDADGGGTAEFSHVSQAASTYSDFQSPSLTVAAGRSYVWFADLEFDSATSKDTISINIVDSTYQPIAGGSIAGFDHPGAVSQGKIRIAIPYSIPTGITAVRVLVAFNCDAGGGGTNKVRIANMGNLRTA